MHHLQARSSFCFCPISCMKMKASHCRVMQINAGPNWTAESWWLDRSFQLEQCGKQWEKESATGFWVWNWLSVACVANSILMHNSLLWCRLTCWPQNHSGGWTPDWKRKLSVVFRSRRWTQNGKSRKNKLICLLSAYAFVIPICLRGAAVPYVQINQLFLWNDNQR